MLMVIMLLLVSGGALATEQRPLEQVVRCPATWPDAPDDHLFIFTGPATYKPRAYKEVTLKDSWRSISHAPDSAKINCYYISGRVLEVKIPGIPIDCISEIKSDYDDLHKSRHYCTWRPTGDPERDAPSSKKIETVKTRCPASWPDNPGEGLADRTIVDGIWAEGEDNLISHFKNGRAVGATIEDLAIVFCRYGPGHGLAARIPGKALVAGTVYCVRPGAGGCHKDDFIAYLPDDASQHREIEYRKTEAPTRQTELAGLRLDMTAAEAWAALNAMGTVTGTMTTPPWTVNRGAGRLVRVWPSRDGAHLVRIQTKEITPEPEIAHSGLTERDVAFYLRFGEPSTDAFAGFSWSGPDDVTFNFDGTDEEGEAKGCRALTDVTLAGGPAKVRQACDDYQSP